MFINNFDPVAFNFFALEIRWYSLSYIFGTNIVSLIDKKISNVSINIPPIEIPKSNVVVNINCDKNNLKDILSKKIQGPVCILIGPEGDFSEKERKSIIEKKGIFSLSLASNILKAETAAIAAVTIVNYHLNFN